jgi:hypothetical protein
MEKSFAEQFAQDWIEAWNAHDLNQVMSHYAENFEMSSPRIIDVAGESSGLLKGKAAVGAYWTIALQRIPELHFELVTSLVGVNSITLYYKGVRGQLAAEVFHFGPDLKVVKAFAHYAV